MISKNISIEDFNYNLPSERIAEYPLEQRDQSKLLLHNNGNLKSDVFSNITQYLPDNSLVVFNNTKVIQARIILTKETGAQIELFCLEPSSPAAYELSFAQKEKCSWYCLVGNAKKWKTDSLNSIININDNEVVLTTTKVKRIDDHFEIEFSWNNSSLTFADIIELVGDTPLPPYIKRKTVEEDKTRYQTVYSKNEGSVAAPTAGLHFTPQLISQLPATDEVTLHVGAGTFKPVKTDDIADHDMHTEHFSISKQTINNILLSNKTVIATGTTTARTLESIYWIGVKLSQNDKDLTLKQWDCYNLPQDIDKTVSAKALLQHMEENNLEQLNAKTQLMIVPKYNYKVISGLITNFHQPKSTLLLLVAAFIGNSWKDMYQYALDNNFRFLSYGDSCFLLR